MSIADRLKGFVFEDTLPSDPTAIKTPRAVPADRRARIQFRGRRYAGGR